ncbi:MAG: VIT1/CCC1 transporter family protein [Anaerolineae bacterium]
MSIFSMQMDKLGQYRRLAGVDAIARRCFANNSFDGILTMVGVIIGSYVAGLLNPRIVLTTGLATCMAMGVSGGWGAYVSERAERRHQLQELEHAMLRNLQLTEQARASRFAVWVITAVDGLSPLLSGSIVLIPFMLSGSLITIQQAYLASLVIALALLFGLGVFLAKVGRDNFIRSGIRMVVAGLVCVLMSFLLSSGSAG